MKTGDEIRFEEDSKPYIIKAMKKVFEEKGKAYAVSPNFVGKNKITYGAGKSSRWKHGSELVIILRHLPDGYEVRCENIIKEKNHTGCNNV